MVQGSILQRTQERFLSELRHHLRGWMAKVARDLSVDAFTAELESLKKDPVYSSFGLATPEYVLIRLMGRLSISIGRRLGEIYDKLPRFITQARFGLNPGDVAPKVDDILQLDVCVPLAKLSLKDRQHVTRVVTAHHVRVTAPWSSLAIEIRYNFNPNDSARLRKDVQMAKLLLAQNMLPIYLIFCTISPRDEAIARLGRAGWTFLVGDAAASFMSELIGMDIQALLSSDVVHDELLREMTSIMKGVYESHAIRVTMAKYV